MGGRSLRRVSAGAVLLLLSAVVPSEAEARWPGAVAPPAMNDDFADATAISSLPFHDEVDARLATDEEGERGCEENSIWYRLAVPDARDFVVTVDTHRAAIVDGSYYVGVTIMRGDQIASLKQVGCIYTYNGSMGFSTFPEESYYIRIAGAYGPVTVDVTRAPNALRGRLTDGLGAPIHGECVRAVPVGSSYAISVLQTDELGRYSYAGIPPGDYQVQFGCGGGAFAAEWFDDVTERDLATILTMPSEGSIENIDASLHASGMLTGRVLNPSGEGADWLCVQLRDPETGELRSFDYADANGSYSVEVYASGAYKLEFGCDWKDDYVNEWYDNSPDFENAQILNLLEGQHHQLPDAVVDVVPPPVNDDFGSATRVGALPYGESKDMVTATLEEGEPAECQGETFGRSVWYSITPSTDQTLVASSFSTDRWDSYMTQVFVGDSLATLTSLGCDVHSYSPPTPSAVAFDAEAGKTYFIQVASDMYVSALTFNIGRPQEAADLLFEWSVPCSVNCGYGLSSSPFTLENLCRPRTKTATSSFSDHLVVVPETLSDGTVPGALVFEAFPKGDYDIFACRTISYEGYYFLGWSANDIDAQCEVGTVIGCKERVAVRVTPGETIRLRAYNWADTEALPARYSFVADGAT